MQGAETELDRQVLEVIKDPLTHMIRNSADHGVETPLERRAAGKPEKGTIRLNAYHEGGTITIEIADDGRGLNLEAIRRKIRERGLAGEAELERMSDAQVAKFIFHPGFSTAKAITALSGRGVGMDVVKTNIELIGGTVEIASEPGRGTTFTVKIPLTLAIVAALIVSAQGQRFAIPQAAVLELVRVKPGSDHAIERINGTPVLRLRERLLPIMPISKMLGLAGSEASAGEEGFVVVSEVGRRRFGILVDGVFHTEEIVVKPMCSKLRHIPLFSGNTILGDGAVVLIMDPNGIARMVGSTAGRDELAGEEPAGEASAEEAETVTLLLFRGGGQSLKAVPLSLVTRLEEIDARKIEWVGGRPLIQYRGRLMPLVPADPAITIRSEGTQALVVFSDEERSMGLVVDEIVDIVDDRLDIELVAETVRPRRLGGRAQPRDRGRRHRALPAARPRGLGRAARAPAVAGGAGGAPRRRLRLLPRDAHARAEGGGLPRRRRGGRRRGARASRRRRQGRGGRHRHRHAGPQRLRPRRGAAGAAGLRGPADRRALLGGNARGGRAGAPARHRRVHREVRPQRPHRRACGDPAGARRSRMIAANGNPPALDERRPFGRVRGIRHRDGRRPDVRPGDRPRARRLHRELAHRGAARAARDRRPPEPARPRRHGDLPAPPPRPSRTAADGVGEMAVGLEHQGEAYGLLVDAVGEVMRLAPESREPNPVHMDARWRKLSRGVHRLDGKLLIVLDVEAVLSFEAEARAA